MNSRKNLLIVASALLASTTAGNAEVRMFFSANRTYRQNPREVAYQSNADNTLWNLRVRAWDGNFFYGCGNSPEFFPPSPFCPLGSTGYLVAGDADGDGQRDDFSYWEIVSLVPGVAFEPNQPDLCSLYSAPPSDLPRPIGAFTDLTDTVFYNLVDASKPLRMYKLPDYSLRLDYADRGTMDNEVVTGEYRFTFPTLRSPETPAQLPVTYYPIPEGYKRNSSVWQGFRFTLLNGKPLAYDSAGFIGIDPRLPNTFSWAGNTADIIFPASDKLYVAVSDLAATPVGDPTRSIDPVKPTIYPGFSATKVSRVQMLTPLVTEVVIPPGFVVPPFPVTTPPSKTFIPREAVVRVMLARMVASSAVCFDNSSRAYELPIRFVNTYEGWAAVAFPPGTPASKRAQTANPDGDSYNNYIEWRNWIVGSALGSTTAPLKPNPMVKDVIAAPILTFVQVQARPTRSTASVGTSHWESKHPKTQGTSPAFTYVYEFSTDLQNWTVIGADHPEWQVSETETEIKCQSKRETLSGNGFLRVRETPAPVQASTVE